ncbi:transcriptional regulator [Catellatospora sp. TT07R-123]|uniref:helix-turn-helix domain-containing protein n=1 Tax=Catellatospora sp. TT07R-123 TaxID=2733863 RepID=UPI001B29FB8D|nr:helix-turn-helix transcriptional regulator [Catellatospora sp. TT07R-123]GHJ46623.1 transcriptional regulator [Catellatospora sp. TT07R-123]
MTVRQSPTVRRRRLGAELRRRREQAGITLEYVADKLECSQSKISRIETGHNSVTSRDVRDMLTIYGAPPGEIDELVEIAKQARQKGWWHPYTNVLVSSFVGMEAAASAIKAYEQQVVPGLLQSAEYAEAMLRAACPDWSDEQVMQRVRVRMKRGSLLLQDDPISFAAVLDESVLSRPVGGDAVMRQQLRLIAEAAAKPDVTIQVLPFERGAHAGMDGTFTILEFAEAGDSAVVYAENATGGLFLEKSDDLEKYLLIFEHLQGAALSPPESAALIAQLAEEPLWKSRPRGFESI